MLHTVIASQTTSTGAGTEDTMASSAFSPSGENEIQERSQIGGLPTLIGYHAVTNDAAMAGTATGGCYFRIGCNTWETARYIKRPFMCGMVATGGPDGASAPSGPVWGTIDKMDRDADWDFRGMTTTGNAAFSIAIYLSYGSVIPFAGESDTWRLVSAATDLTASVWGTIGNINDLDPRFKYRVNELIMVCEDKSCLACRVTSPSNNTYVGGLSNQIVEGAGNTNPWSIRFPIDSIIVSGVETIQVEGLVDTASKPSVYVGLKRIGAASAVSSPTIGGGGVSGLGASSSLGGIGGLLSGLMR